MAATIKVVWDRIWSEGEQQKIFPTKTNSHIEDIRETVLNWVKESGIGDTNAIATFKGLDYDGHTAFIYPQATHSQLLLAAKWITWLFLFDNYIDEQPINRLTRGSLAFLKTANQIISGHPPDREALECPYTKPFADLWSEARSLYLRRGWERRFAAHFYNYRQAMLWELCHRQHKRVWDYQTYVEMKRCCTGSQVGASFVELFVSAPVPDHFMDSFLAQKLFHTYGDILHMATDIRSYEREASLDPIPNIISTLEYTLNYSFDEASDLFIGLWKSKAQYIRQFINDLDILLASLGMDTHQQEIIHEYVDCLMLWAGGNMRWLAYSSRYALIKEGTDAN